MTDAERAAKYGRFAYKPAPVAGNPEAIAIDTAWVMANIVSITLPWPALPVKPRRIQVHKLAAPTILAVWQAWADAGLLGKVLTFDGAWVPRYKRGRTGSDANLSNHAWGTAFDINAKWNRLGYPPAQPGTTGCLLDLVPIAKAHGMAWGGDFRGGRLDAMHLECT